MALLLEQLCRGFEMLERLTHNQVQATQKLERTPKIAGVHADLRKAEERCVCKCVPFDLSGKDIFKDLLRRTDVARLFANWTFTRVLNGCCRSAIREGFNLRTQSW